MTPGRASQSQSGNQGLRIQLSQDECQSLRITGMPSSAGKADIVHWLENRLGRGSIIAKIAPLVSSSSKQETKDTVVTLSDVATAKQAEAILNLSFPTKAGDIRQQITIDHEFHGLTCLYSSIKSPDKQPNIDVILVHGAHGHPINSFACHYTEPGSEVMWPRDILPKTLEEAGVFPRVMTFGWDASSWLDPHKRIPHPCDDLMEAPKKERPGTFNRPLVFIGHGIGGFLAKQVVIKTINSGYAFQIFENPVKACYFLAVPHNDGSSEDGFAPVLSNMQSILGYGSQPERSLVKALKSRNRNLSNLSEEFDAIRKEHGIDCVSFTGQRGTPEHVVVPVHQATLDESPEKAHHLDADYREIARLSMQENLKTILNEVCKSIFEKLDLPKVKVRPPVRQPDKERVYALLKR
ncbi:hypothetical protein MMC28_006399 [Mycoblastus sanguinarius]|nr:hypothetical protein [Mycoblastus sanguinarius]